MAETVATKLMTQPPNQILWIVTIRNIAIIDYLIKNHNAVCFTNTYNIAYKDEPIVIFDFTKLTKVNINYSLIRDLKSGILKKYFTPPKILVLSRHPPNKFALHALSEYKIDIS